MSGLAPLIDIVERSDVLDQQVVIDYLKVPALVELRAVEKVVAVTVRPDSPHRNVTATQKTGSTNPLHQPATYAQETSPIPTAEKAGPTRHNSGIWATQQGRARIPAAPRLRPSFTFTRA